MNITIPKDPTFKTYYRKHLQCLKLAGLQSKTIEAYARAIRRISNYFNCKIDNLNEDQRLDYFNALLDTHSWSAVKLDLYGLKFFYTHVLGKAWTHIPLIKPPKTLRIPDILSVERPWADLVFHRGLPTTNNERTESVCIGLSYKQLHQDRLCMVLQIGDNQISLFY